MPLDWNVDHDARLIVITATGSVTREDVDAYLAASVARGEGGYRTAIDARAAEASLRPGDVAAFSQIVGGRQNDAVSSGRIAIVVGSDAERAMARYFADRTEDQRPCRLFSDIEDAMAWLDEPSPPRKPT